MSHYRRPYHYNNHRCYYPRYTNDYSDSDTDSYSDSSSDNYHEREPCCYHRKSHSRTIYHPSTPFHHKVSREPDFPIDSYGNTMSLAWYILAFNTPVQTDFDNLELEIHASKTACNGNPFFHQLLCFKREVSESDIRKRYPTAKTINIPDDIEQTFNRIAREPTHSCTKHGVNFKMPCTNRRNDYV